MNNCAIIVPIYKTNLEKSEIDSFVQLLNVLKKYTIILVTYKSLNTQDYLRISQLVNKKIQFKYFDEVYFKTLYGYNSLCLTKNFYTAFSDYIYILIYQLDAFVFRDELEVWCQKGFDYIGAPWFEDNKSREQGANLWAVGNGGFSLRKVSTFIRLFESKQPVFGFKYLYKKTIRENKSFLWFLKAWILRFENNFNYLLNSWEDAEDLFYCLKLSDTNFRLKIPDIKTAIEFAFEQSPRYLFNLNGNKLPFGCHAWEKYEYETFWKKYL